MVSLPEALVVSPDLPLVIRPPAALPSVEAPRQCGIDGECRQCRQCPARAAPPSMALADIAETEEETALAALQRFWGEHSHVGYYGAKLTEPSEPAGRRGQPPLAGEARLRPSLARLQ